MGWNDDGDKGPWGKKNNSNRQSDNPNIPDIEDIFQKGSQHFKNMMGKGGDGFNPRMIGLFALIGILLWLGTGFYRIQEGEQGAVIRLGKLNRITDQGLRYHLPSPIEEVLIKKVTNIEIVQSGQAFFKSNRTAVALRGENIQDLMLTGDENIVKLRYTVQWFIKDLGKFLFNDPRPEQTIRLAADSAVREIIAQTTLDEALTVGKAEISIKAKKLLQKMLDDYEVGIDVIKVNLEEVNPPDSVIAAFRDVQAANADRQRLINGALAYEKSVVPVARGKAQGVIKSGEAIKESLINRAQGDAARFEAVLKEYVLAPEVTMTRLKIQTSEQVLKGSQKYLVSGDKTSQGVLPYLPLNALTKPTEKKAD